jgi:hypothetical protein
VISYRRLQIPTPPDTTKAQLTLVILFIPIQSGGSWSKRGARPPRQKDFSAGWAQRPVRLRKQGQIAIEFRSASSTPTCRHRHLWIEGSRPTVKLASHQNTRSFPVWQGRIHSFELYALYHDLPIVPVDSLARQTNTDCSPSVDSRTRVTEVRPGLSAPALREKIGGSRGNSNLSHLVYYSGAGR